MPPGVGGRVVVVVTIAGEAVGVGRGTVVRDGSIDDEDGGFVILIGRDNDPQPNKGVLPVV